MSSNGGPIGTFFKNIWNGITGVTAAETAAAAQQKGFAQAQSVLQQQSAKQEELMNMLMQQFAPYQDAGTAALGQMQGLTGALGSDAQQAAIDALAASPQFQAQLQQGENALLQNTAATGGLRGGNTQAALAQFRPALLQNTIQQQIGNLGSLAGMGLQGASGVAGGIAGTQGNLLGIAEGRSNLATGAGDAQSAAILAKYQLQRDLANEFAGLLKPVIATGLAGAI